MKQHSVVFVLCVVATVAMIVNISSCSTRNQEQKVATKIRRKIQEEKIRQTDLGFNIGSKTITNDVQWKDNHGNLLDVSRGGKISHIDGNFWWVGTKPSSSSNSDYAGDIGDIYLYKSSTLGSNSWEFVRKLVDNPTTLLRTGANCQLSKHPINDTYHLHCKNREFYMSKSIDGEFQKIPKPTDPSNNSGWRWGANCVYQEKSDMYLLTSMSQRVDDKNVGSTRTLYIFKMNESWTGFDATAPVVASWSWVNREGIFLFKRGKKYFLTASQTAEWKDSKTWFRSAKSLQGLSQVDDVEVLFYPDNTSDVKSMGSQQRQFVKVAHGQWLYMGSRHPDEDPVEYDSRYGRSILAPVRFVNGVPNVYWKNQFDIDTYGFKSGDYDKHFHGGYGHMVHDGCFKLKEKRFCIRTAGCEWRSWSGKCREIKFG